MDRIRIVGGQKLEGVIPISGAKNAALPLMIASLLTKDTLTLENMPLLADVTQLERILGNHGVDFLIFIAFCRPRNNIHHAFQPMILTKSCFIASREITGSCKMTAFHLTACCLHLLNLSVGPNEWQ